MTDEDKYDAQELEEILFHLQYSHKRILWCEEEGKYMKTVKQNLEYLIDDVQTKIKELEAQNDQNI